jgi:DNA-binding transcriptional LysR family regulator
MDFNLYPVFLEIMRQGSVSKAADALGLTQSATSNALARLRAQMADPLFVRTRKGMLPTHFAKDIRPRIERAVETLQSVSAAAAPELHELRELRRRFTIVMSDLEETLFLPQLIEQLAATAPQVQVEVKQFQRENLRHNMERGRIDFVLAHLTAPIKNIVSKPVSKQEFVCLARAGHRRLDGPLSLAQYTALGHVLVAPDRGGTRGVIDDQLKKMDHRRNVVCSVPHFLPACLLAARSEHLLTVPRLLGETVAEPFALELHELPFSMPRFTIGLHWHRTRDSDPEHASFRAFVLNLIAG